LLGDFGPALALADVVFLTDIYPAGEDADRRRDARIAGCRSPALGTCAPCRARRSIVCRRRLRIRHVTVIWS
jgi:hypothetical protein